MSLTSLIDRRPLSESERMLIDVAVTAAWDEPLRDVLAWYAQKRGMPISAYDTPGTIVDALLATAGRG